MSAFLDDEHPSSFLDNKFPVDQKKCGLLGPTALVVQALMGVLVIISLLYKRQREKPKRPWKIWMFDVSKQIAGQLFVHSVNVLISDVGAHHSSGNPCALYFLNILIDTTLGVGIIYFMLHIITYIFTSKLYLKGFESGQYGDPPSFRYWARQAAVYVVSLMSMKLLVVGLFAVWPSIAAIGDWLLSWTGGRDATQVIFVMGVFPIVMNVLQFWLIDSIVKASDWQNNGARALPSDQSADRELLLSTEDETIQPQEGDIESQTAASSSRPASANSRSESGEKLERKRETFFAKRKIDDDQEA